MKRGRRLIPLEKISLFCPFTPARVVVEVISGAAWLDGSARAKTKIRVPDLCIVALSAFLLLIDVVADAFAIMRLIMLLLVAVLR